MRNQRLRRAMGLKQLAKALRLNPFTVARYEQNRSNPTPARATAAQAAAGSRVREVPEGRYNIRWSRGRPTLAAGLPRTPAVMKRRSKPLPKFKSEAEEAEFWDTHSAADYLNQLKIARNVQFRFRPRTRTSKLRTPQ